jgi:hypothetical protein
MTRVGPPSLWVARGPADALSPLRRTVCGRRLPLDLLFLLAIAAFFAVAIAYAHVIERL